MLLTDPILDRLVWLAENYRTAATSLSDDRLADIRQGIRVWGWSGIIVGAVALPFWQSRVRDAVAGLVQRGVDRLSRPLPLPADRYGLTFLLAAGGVLAFTALTHWSLTLYENVDWFEGEDGISEWWSVATYFAAAALAGATALRLRKTGHRRLLSLQVVLAGVLLVGAMEEISWGQRLFDWGTPRALDAINQQGETTIHNVRSLDSVISHIFFWGSVAALAGGAVRALWHRFGRVTSADFLLPSLVLAPALLMILVWHLNVFWLPVNLPRLLMESFDLGPQGTEVPEVLLGLCLCIYTYGNLRRASRLPKPISAARQEDPRRER